MCPALLPRVRFSTHAPTICLPRYRAEYERLLPQLEIVSLDVWEVVAARGEPLIHAYFPLTGVIALVATDTSVTQAVRDLRCAGRITYRRETIAILD